MWLASDYYLSRKVKYEFDQIWKTNKVISESMWYLKVTLYDIILIDLLRTNETIAIRVQRDFWSSERQLFDWREPIHSCYGIACGFFQLEMF